MTINPLLSAISTALAQQSAPASVRPAATSTDISPQDVANTADSSPPSPVLQNAALVNASSNFAQLGSLLEVAQSGTQQVGSLIEQLQSLAQQAASGGGDAISDVDSQFQQILAEVDSAVTGTTFGGTPLLGGAFSGNSSNQAGSLSLPDLSTQGLFGQTPPSIATPDAATAALASLADAQNTVGGAAAAIDSTQQELSFAVASVDTALANGSAAASTLGDSDLGSAAVSGAASAFLGQSAALTRAQGGNNTGSLLSLLQE